MELTERDRKINLKCKELVKSLYKTDEGDPFVLTAGQVDIFRAIFKKEHPRVHIETHTRYGKSETVAIAVLTRASMFPEKWAIVAGNKEKAGIIIEKLIKHIFDNKLISSKFVLDKGEIAEAIRRYKNKNKINFNVGDGLLGEVFITAAKNAMGLGSPNVVEDESALISAKDHALVMRMLGDQTDNFLVKIGNPWESDHFTGSYEDPAYKKIRVDYVQGIKEGRLLPAYVDEMRKQPFFDVLYECNRPKQGMSDDKGWISLLTRDEIERALVQPVVGAETGFGIKKLGVDVAGGGRNYSVIVKRRTNIARVIVKNQDPDTMNLAENVINIKNRDEIESADISIDKVGIGKGIYDMLNRQFPVYGINAGDTPTTDENKEKFSNLRAELFWKLRDWVLGGGKLEIGLADWYQLTKIKYRIKLEGTKGKIKIISKVELLKMGVESPDDADALSMTFITDDVMPPDPEIEEMREQQETKEAFDPLNPFNNI